ncbi:lipid-binding SYLF domain-containing protein [Bombella favorum]|uniref:Ysc84 actin-binding domain-containing protein n=1 Tax=Bombella favorum TaxID=2039164 RepID=A0ABR5ZKS3_9PROT|nr:lipid-binding SYLF domain-containing protein [Bombella favorum]MBA5724921.1 hypothetical protein [Bombella favorum]
MSKSFSLVLRTASITAGASLLALSAYASDAAAAKASKQQALVNKATFAVQSALLDSKVKENTAHILRETKAVVICPDVTKMSLVFGGSGGRCVLLARGANNSWSDPAFYHLSAGSFGIQAGYQHSQLFFFVTSQKALLNLMDHEFSFDASADAAFGNNSSSTQNTPKEVYAMQKTKGVSAGVSLGSSKLKPDSEANRTYYHQVVGPEDIVVRMQVNNKAADPLRRVVMKAFNQ